MSIKIKPTIHVLASSHVRQDIIDQILQTEDAFLLLGDGIYYLSKLTTHQVYVLTSDLRARIPNFFLPNKSVNLIDFAKVVDLTLTHKMISW